MTTGGDFLYIINHNFPKYLDRLSCPPSQLYLYGDRELIQRDPIFAVVGARDATPYGLRMADHFACELARNGYVIISGFARGIDRAAHLGAMKGGGKTIAVLGCGIDADYPAGQRALKRRLMTDHLVITEYDRGIKPRPGHFPHRNRLIAGLSEGVLVIEGRIRSGTYSTVTHALEQGKVVFAVPGPVDSEMSEGPNQMIKDGAIPVTGIKDILDYFSFFSKTTY